MTHPIDAMRIFYLKLSKESPDLKQRLYAEFMHDICPAYMRMMEKLQRTESEEVVKSTIYAIAASMVITMFGPFLDDQDLTNLDTDEITQGFSRYLKAMLTDQGLKQYTKIPIDGTVDAKYQ